MVTGKCTDVYTCLGGFFGLGGRAEGGGGYVGEYFHGETSHGEENFNEGGAWFSRIIWKNNEKINMKSFSYWK